MADNTPADGLPRLDQLIKKRPPRPIVSADEVSAAVAAAGDSLGFAVPRTDAVAEPPLPSPVRNDVSTSGTADQGQKPERQPTTATRTHTRRGGPPSTGRPSKCPPTSEEAVRLTLTLSNASVVALKLAAIGSGRSPSDVVDAALAAYLKS